MLFSYFLVLNITMILIFILKMILASSDYYSMLEIRVNKIMTHHELIYNLEFELVLCHYFKINTI